LRYLYQIWFFSCPKWPFSLDLFLESPK